MPYILPEGVFSGSKRLKAGLHPREELRLEALRGFDILDTAPEPGFDRIVALARDICEVPICLISFVETERQWFKANVGLDCSETPIDVAICAHVVAGGQSIEIPDTLEDERTRDNPLCTDDGIRFYAGALLLTQDGLPLGTLCVLDHRPRELTALQRETLETLAEQVVRRLELGQALAQQELLRREIDHRVKNSLTTVAGLIRLQREQADDDGVEAILADVEGRIELVAALHGELHQTSVAEKVDVRALLEKIESYLQRSAPSGIAINIVADRLVLPSEQASAIAYVANEFVANSFKHAFPGTSRGKVEIALCRADDQIELTCRDDGVGAEQFDPQRIDRGLGIRIIKACAKQLRAEVDWPRPSRGFAMRLRWNDRALGE